MRVKRMVSDALLAFNIRLGRMLSWPIWLPVLLVGSLFGLAIHMNDVIMVVLTIQTAVDSAATKILQTQVHEKDEQRDNMIAAMLQQSEKRDKLAAKQMSMLVASVTSLNDLLDILVKGGVLENESARKISRRTGRPGKANGRANRAKS